MNNVNKTEIIGYIAKDVNLRKTNNDGKPVANMTVVTKEYIGKGKEHHTEWHNIVLWGQPAEYAGKWAGKGDLVRIEGANRQKDWEDKEGNKRRSMEISATSFMILKKKAEFTDEDRKAEEGYAGDDDDNQTAPPPARTTGTATTTRNPYDTSDEDAPF